MKERKPVAIDPPGCGCTECIIGEYVPLDRASDKQIQRMIAGKLADHTGGEWKVNRKVEFIYNGVIWTSWTDDD